MDRPGSGADFEADLRDADQLRSAVKQARPEGCIHLGGIAFVPLSWKQPSTVHEINATGTLRLLEVLRDEADNCRCLTVTSAEIYGRSPRKGKVTEDDPPHPENPYALSKWAADRGALLFAEHFGMPVMTARPGNHIGPGQNPDFVTTAFAKQLVDMKRSGQNEVMKVGNLESARDLADVRDIARGYRLLLEKGTAGQAYNLATGKATPIQKLLDQLMDITGIHPSVEVDPARYRPTDHLPLLDCSKIRAQTGWQAEIDISRTLQDIAEELLKAP